MSHADCAGQESVVYSGADDCMFKGWDLRQPVTSPLFVNRQAFLLPLTVLKSHCSFGLLVISLLLQAVSSWSGLNCKLLMLNMHIASNSAA